jgi:hypothetical protein
MEILSKILRIKFYHPDRQQKCKKKEMQWNLMTIESRQLVQILCIY